MEENPSTEPVAGSGINPRDRGMDRIDPREIFGNDHPVILEIGSGKGRFLVRSAQENSDTNYLGIEKSLHYYRVIRNRIDRWRLTNVRIVNYDAALVVSRMLPDDAIREIHIYFPDPWPRPKERKRRIVREGVVEHFRRVLEPAGIGYYVTDHREYFDKAVPVLGSIFDIDTFEVGEGEPRTNYEAKYRKAGRPIFQVTFRPR